MLSLHPCRLFSDQQYYCCLIISSFRRYRKLLTQVIWFVQKYFDLFQKAHQIKFLNTVALKLNKLTFYFRPSADMYSQYVV